ncbi:MAG TPA: cell division protein ZapE [Rhodanobacteraceae bacterium]|nr:cell division protein ZapE [Rhodanobacteraceae bacterium]
MTVDPALPGARYRAGVAAHRWQDDPAQHRALAELDRLHRLLSAPVRAPRWRHWLHLPPVRHDTAAPHCGLYLWGDVGRGKTFLMDLLVAGLPSEVVMRQHFHRFMAGVHEALRALGEREDPLAQVAEDYAARVRLLCLDEFIVGDIGDAMILAGLLRGLFERGVVLVTTSNTAPGELYRGGLQRARFLPAIASIERHCRVLRLESPHDWRRRALREAPVYQAPADAEAEQVLASIFEAYATGEVEGGGVLQIHGRDIAVRRRAGNMAWFDFAALCEGPRSVADYIELARRFDAVIVSRVPRFDDDARDPARRFVQLVDEFYDRRAKLVLSAAAPILGLYDGTRLRGEFDRAESRLVQMQSREYLEAPRREA